MLNELKKLSMASMPVMFQDGPFERAMFLLNDHATWGTARVLVKQYNKRIQYRRLLSQSETESIRR